MAEIRWTIEAEIWLKDIYDYITQDNPGAAAKVVEGIYEKAQLLKEYRNCSPGVCISLKNP